VLCPCRMARLFSKLLFSSTALFLNSLTPFVSSPVLFLQEARAGVSGVHTFISSAVHIRNMASQSIHVCTYVAAATKQRQQRRDCGH
jgi:hypothetical protein